MNMVASNTTRSFKLLYRCSTQLGATISVTCFSLVCARVIFCRCGQSYENLTTQKFNPRKFFRTKISQFTVHPYNHTISICNPVSVSIVLVELIIPGRLENLHSTTAFFTCCTLGEEGIPFCLLLDVCKLGLNSSEVGVPNTLLNGW